MAKGIDGWRVGRHERGRGDKKDVERVRGVDKVGIRKIQGASRIRTLSRDCKDCRGCTHNIARRAHSIHIPPPRPTGCESDGDLNYALWGDYKP
jgi:hypothetical protein